MHDIKIVEYQEGMAAALADMWTRSGDGWGGWSTQFTAEQVRQEEATSDHVNLFLATKGEEVVGYCKIGKWHEEEGALYVALFNVRPDLHGQKIGKALMLRSVERTLELGWPRLDLHTWPGNTKAVPLYKKTGFFWEERDAEVYLVNFIPSVLSFGMTKGYFQHVDWYANSTRVIEVQPDGVMENGFTYFMYSWELDGRKMDIEFERKGRGLRSVVRDDYSVTATIPEQKLIHDATYKIAYEFENRSDTPLEITIQGQDDKNVVFGFSHTGTVDDRETIVAQFTVGSIKEEQHEWKTHPRVSAEITVNGQSALFQVGIVPLMPAEIRLTPQSKYTLPNKAGTAALEVKSNLLESVSLELSISDDESVQFSENLIQIEIDAEGRAAKDIAFTQTAACAYTGTVTGTALTASGKKMTIEREVGAIFPTLTGSFFGEIALPDSERAYVAGAGAYTLKQIHQTNDFRNNVQFMNVVQNAYIGRFAEPKIGKPYADEFMKRSADSVEYLSEGGSVSIVSRFVSKSKKGIEVRMIVRVSPGGLAQRTFELVNIGKERVEDLYVMDSFRIDLGEVYVPYDGKVLEIRGETRASYEQWDKSRFSGNWMFSQNSKRTTAVIWDKAVSIQFGEWYAFFEHGPIQLDPGEIHTTPPFTVYANVFSTWQECRQAAIAPTSPEKGETEKVLNPPPVAESLEFQANGGNPFAGSDIDIKIVEHKQKHMAGVVRIESTGGEVQEKQITTDQNIKELDFNVPLHTQSDVEMMTLTRTSSVGEYQRKRVVFPLSGEAVQLEESNGAFIADNGRLRISLNLAYAPALYSCAYSGREWLHSSYPNPGPMDWWNPWIGGICMHPRRMEAQPLLKEKHDARLCSYTDQAGNVWRGIAVKTRFAENEDWRGLVYEQRYMLLPGAPVLMIHGLVLDSGGRRFINRAFTTELFTRPVEDINVCRYRFRNRQGQRAALIPGKEECWLGPHGDVSIGAEGLADNAHIVVDPAVTHIGFEANKGTMQTQLNDWISCSPGSGVDIPPKFLVFSAEELRDDWLVDLVNLKLEDTQ